MREILLCLIVLTVYYYVKLSSDEGDDKFSTPVTPVMEGVVDLHDHIFLFLVLIFFFVFVIFVFLLRYFLYRNNYLFFFEKFLLSKYSIYPFIFLGFFIEEATLEAQLLSLEGAPLGKYAFLRDYVEEDKTKDSQHLHFTRIEEFRTVYSVSYEQSIKSLVGYRNYVHHELLEIIWTIVPAFILVFIAIPSFALLYAMDELLEALFVIKVIGYQWFWAYEYTREESYEFLMEESENMEHSKIFIAEHSALNYSSIMSSEDDLILGKQRLLEVDHELILPRLMPLRLVVASGDVLHSWAVPSFGLKVDAVPGRLSHIPLYIDYSGSFYGQCSELCGVGHGFMPIVLKIVNWVNFSVWYWTFSFYIH